MIHKHALRKWHSFSANKTDQGFSVGLFFNLNLDVLRVLFDANIALDFTKGVAGQSERPFKVKKSSCGHRFCHPIGDGGLVTKPFDIGLTGCRHR